MDAEGVGRGYRAEPEYIEDIEQGRREPGINALAIIAKRLNAKIPDIKGKIRGISG